MAEKLLEVDDLHVQFRTEDGVVRAVDGVSFDLERGKVLGIVGESGSGKSVTAMTLLGLTRGVNAHFEGRIEYKGEDLLKMSEAELRRFRGRELAMIFQDPMTAMNPVYKVGSRSAKRFARTRTSTIGRPETVQCNSCGRSAFRIRKNGSTTIRTSSRAACASAR